ncbi:MAG: VWA domain-containing protein [Burkholderiales bacterium]
MNLPLSVQSGWPAMLLLAIPVAWWIARHTHTTLSPRHLKTVAGLRMLGIACLALALMRPQWLTESSDVSVVYALDVSRSVSSEFIDAALTWMEESNRRHQPASARYLAFADRAVMVDSPDAIRALSVSEGARRDGVLDQAATNLEQAVEVALLGLDRERVKRLVLMTDGNQTEGEVRQLLPRLQEAGVRVYPVAARVRDEGDVWLDGFAVPEGSRAGEPMSVTVRVFAPQETRARILIRNSSTPLAARNVTLKPGFNPVEIELRISKPGPAMLSAQLTSAQDKVPDNNQLQRQVWVGAKARVLMVDSQPERAVSLRDALTAEGMQVNLAAPAELEAMVDAFAEYEALILSDVPAAALSVETMIRIEKFVRDDGGGLLFIGGENVFGEKGYSGTVAEKILPVQFKAREKHQDLALVIALDRSYSMKGRKVEMAKEATRAALDLLEEQHQFAVVAFDSQPYIAVPMQTARSRRKAEDQISRVQASGQTNIYPALGIVYRLLQKSDAKARHVILLSDGDTHPADFETLLKRMTAEKIVVSTVAIGEGADRGLMSDIARWGKGRAYVTLSAEAIPQIFVEETRRAVHSNLQEESFKPVVARQSQVFQGLDMNALPELKGYVSTKPRDTAEVLLTTPAGSPVLTRWQYGLGKVAMFASDASSRWAVNWLEWKGFGKLWGQTVRELLRRDSGERLDFRVVRQRDLALMSLSALSLEGQFLDSLAPRIRVSRADGVRETVLLRQSGPGTYVGRIPLGPAATAGFELLPSAGIGASSIARAGARYLSAQYADEYRFRPPDLELLDTLAKHTGGRRGADAAQIFASQGDRSHTAHRLWPGFALMALLYFLIDIAARRSALAWRWLRS